MNKSMRKSMSEKSALKAYYAEQSAKENEAKFCYGAVQHRFQGKADAVYEDAIVDIVGVKGLQLLREFKLIESCGIINGRKLYAL